MKKLVVFGLGTASALAARAIEVDTGRAVIGFTVDGKALTASEFEGCPVYAFENLQSEIGLEDYELVLPLGFRRINWLRREKLEQARSLGISIGSWASKRAVIPQEFRPQANTLVYEGVIIQHFASIGENVILRSGVNVGHHSSIGNHSFLASGVVTGGRVQIGEHCWVGLGAVIRDGVTLAPRTFVGAGAVVLGDTEPDGVYVGVPARRLPNKTSMELTA